MKSLPLGDLELLSRSRAPSGRLDCWRRHGEVRNVLSLMKSRLESLKMEVKKGGKNANGKDHTKGYGKAGNDWKGYSKGGKGGWVGSSWYDGWERDARSPVRRPDGSRSRSGSQDSQDSMYRKRARSRSPSKLAVNVTNSEVVGPGASSSS